jgi:RNA polymerase sigma-70 factor (ECF subfamily)
MGYPTAWENDLIMPRADTTSTDAPVCSDTPDTSDGRLVELVLAGDETAFEQLFERYKRLVGATAARYFQQPEQIEEMIQITFAKVFFELKNFRGRHDFSLASWLGRITTNTCLNTLRTKKCRAESQLGEIQKAEINKFLTSSSYNGRHSRSDMGAEDSLINRDLAEKLLSNLPPEDRALLQMLYVEEKNIGEVAAATGWSVSNVKVRAHRARKTLRKVLRKFL